MTRAPAPLAVLLVLAAACARPEPPDATYRALVAAARARDADRAWGLLSSTTQAWLDARAKAAAARAPGVVAPSGKELLVAGSGGARPPRSIVALRESADRAVLQITDDQGAAREVTLVREGRWRVELPEPSR